MPSDSEALPQQTGPVPDFPSLPVFVCHYRGNPERRAYLESLHVEMSFVTQCDREDLTPEQLQPATDPEQTRRALRSIVPTLIFNNILHASIREGKVVPVGHLYNQIYELAQNEQWLEQNTPQIQLKPSEVSLFHKHWVAVDRFRRTRAPWGLVMEDDVIFRPDSASRLQVLLQELPRALDYVDIGGGVGLSGVPAFRRLPGLRSSLYRVDPPASRTTCAYLISRDFADRLVDIPAQAVMPIDFFYNHLFLQLDARVCWLEPPLFVHGSEHGYYGSNLR